MFVEDGYWIYNTLITDIGEREKLCLSLASMCLWTWLKQLGEDTNIESFADPNPLNFDKWLSSEMNKTGGGYHKGKTSYHIMMSTFGKPYDGRNKQQLIAHQGELEILLKWQHHKKNHLVQRLPNHLVKRLWFKRARI